MRQRKPATAAFRFGHSMPGNDVEFLDNNGYGVRDALPLANAFFNPAVVQQTNIDPILRYLDSDLPARGRAGGPAGRRAARYVLDCECDASGRTAHSSAANPDSASASNASGALRRFAARCGALRRAAALCGALRRFAARCGALRRPADRHAPFIFDPHWQTKGLSW